MSGTLGPCNCGYLRIDAIKIRIIEQPGLEIARIWVEWNSWLILSFNVKRYLNNYVGVQFFNTNFATLAWSGENLRVTASQKRVPLQCTGQSEEGLVRTTAWHTGPFYCKMGILDHATPFCFWYWNSKINQAVKYGIQQLPIYIFSIWRYDEQDPTLAQHWQFALKTYKS